MANRLVGNVYIIDSHQVATKLPYQGKLNVATVAFWGSTSAATFEISGPTTTDVVVKMEIGDPGGTTNSIFVNNTFDEIYVPTITAGTAWLYLQ